MDRNITIWERLERYRQELIEQCERANRQMDHNRKIREMWHARTIRWKKEWLCGDGEQNLEQTVEGKETPEYSGESPEFPFL